MEYQKEIYILWGDSWRGKLRSRLFGAGKKDKGGAVSTLGESYFYIMMIIYVTYSAFMWEM